MKRSLSLVLALSLLWSPAVWAVSSQYIVNGTPITFQDSGGTYVLPFASTGAGAGKFSDRANKGAGAQPATYWWTCTFTTSGTVTVGQFFEVYISLSDNASTTTNTDGALAATNGTLSTDKRRNLKRVGTVVADQTASGVAMTGSGQAFINTQFFSVAFWDATGSGLSATANASKCTFTPAYWQMQ